MTQSNNAVNDIQTAMRMIETSESSHIRLNANGGNSVLIVCDPSAEKEYIENIYQFMKKDKYKIIDINSVLCDFISNNKETIEEMFELLQGSIKQIFNSPTGEENDDLLKQILNKINLSFQENKIPVLINVGALYGSGIENIHIMENEIVMKAKFPVAILYPATHDGDKLMFLDKRPASKYRCMIVE